MGAGRNGAFIGRPGTLGFEGRGQALDFTAVLNKEMELVY